MKNDSRSFVFKDNIQGNIISRKNYIIREIYNEISDTQAARDCWRGNKACKYHVSQRIRFVLIKSWMKLLFLQVTRVENERRRRRWAAFWPDLEAVSFSLKITKLNHKAWRIRKTIKFGFFLVSFRGTANWFLKDALIHRPEIMLLSVLRNNSINSRPIKNSIFDSIKHRFAMESSLFLARFMQHSFKYLLFLLSLFIRRDETLPWAAFWFQPWTTALNWA